MPPFLSIGAPKGKGWPTFGPDGKVVKDETPAEVEPEAEVSDAS
jgi:hypothetical protein